MPGSPYKQGLTILDRPQQEGHREVALLFSRGSSWSGRERLLFLDNRPVKQIGQLVRVEVVVLVKTLIDGGLEGIARRPGWKRAGELDVNVVQHQWRVEKDQSLGAPVKRTSKRVFIRWSFVPANTVERSLQVRISAVVECSTGSVLSGGAPQEVHRPMDVITVDYTY